MKNTLYMFLADNRGFTVSMELVLIAAIAVIGLVTGLASIRDGVVSELSDTGGSMQDLNQSFALIGICGHSSQTEGSDYRDRLDFCDSPDDRSGQADNCIHFVVRPKDEQR